MKPELKTITISGRDYAVCSVCEHTPIKCVCEDDGIECDCGFCNLDFDDDDYTCDYCCGYDCKHEECYLEDKNDA